MRFRAKRHFHLGILAAEGGKQGLHEEFNVTGKGKSIPEMYADKERKEGAWMIETRTKKTFSNNDYWAIDSRGNMRLTENAMLNASKIVGLFNTHNNEEKDGEEEGVLVELIMRLESVIVRSRKKETLSFQIKIGGIVVAEDRADLKPPPAVYLVYSNSAPGASLMSL